MPNMESVCTLLQKNRAHLNTASSILGKKITDYDTVHHNLATNNLIEIYRVLVNNYLFHRQNHQISEMIQTLIKLNIVLDYELFLMISASRPSRSPSGTVYKYYNTINDAQTYRLQNGYKNIFSDGCRIYRNALYEHHNNPVYLVRHAFEMSQRIISTSQDNYSNYFYTMPGAYYYEPDITGLFSVAYAVNINKKPTRRYFANCIATTLFICSITNCSLGIIYDLADSGDSWHTHWKYTQKIGFFGGLSYGVSHWTPFIDGDFLSPVEGEHIAHTPIPPLNINFFKLLTYPIMDAYVSYGILNNLTNPVYDYAAKLFDFFEKVLPINDTQNADQCMTPNKI